MEKAKGTLTQKMLHYQPYWCTDLFTTADDIIGLAEQGVLVKSLIWLYPAPAEGAPAAPEPPPAFAHFYAQKEAATWGTTLSEIATIEVAIGDQGNVFCQPPDGSKVRGPDIAPSKEPGSVPVSGACGEGRDRVRNFRWLLKLRGVTYILASTCISFSCVASLLVCSQKPCCMCTLVIAACARIFSSRLPLPAWLLTPGNSLPQSLQRPPPKARASPLLPWTSRPATCSGRPSWRGC